jgi:hypothetical protein
MPPTATATNRLRVRAMISAAATRKVSSVT